MKLILLELNEINFDVVKLYIEKGHKLNGFKKIFDDGILNTKAEDEYNNLEPWIQWPSVHTGKTFKEHNIFRLGDFINSSDEQFFEKIERAGFSVGAVSPMNAANRLSNPTYFIPDPWTKTSPDNSFYSKIITEAIAQAVNDNSQSKLTFKTILKLILAFFVLVRPSRYFSLTKYALFAIGRPWRKALFLDMFLYEIHKTLYRRKKPDFSTLFLNAGAHIQHHYFFNSPYVASEKLRNPNWYIESKDDPFLEMLKVYNDILIDVLDHKNTEVIIATGLSQKPYDELKFYYRLKDHKKFLKKIGINFIDVAPRMTRDFLISFDSIEKAAYAEMQLSKILVNNNERLFGEIDNRGEDIFVVLTYPHEINEKTEISYSESKLLLNEHVTFVAIKNGEHQEKGFLYFTKGLKKFAPTQNSHVSKINNIILKFFEIND